MELSILIPVYNWDISALLGKLLAEIDAFSLQEAVEVIVLDDCSSDAALRDRNSRFASDNGRSYLKYGGLQKNAGRAAVRNTLAADASGSFLLFLDCDVLPDNEDFVRSYLGCAREKSYDVVCGGISYRTRILNGAEFNYHAYLGNKKEVKSAEERNQSPWRFILTSNIMVRKTVFQGTPFNENFTGYGYEDIEWGVRLAENYRILHIDNTASHLGLVTKAKAYEKMCNSVPNYLLLREICPHAYSASTISRFVIFFERCSARLLRFLDRRLKQLCLMDGIGNRFVFLFFQLDFAVLLALALKDGDKRSKLELPE